MQTIRRIGTAAALFAVAILFSGCDRTVVVETNKGPIGGLDLGDAKVFRGIPYATPPLGELRWRAPAPIPAWQETLDATEFGPACWQDNSAGNSVFLSNMLQGSGMPAHGRWLITQFSGFAETTMSEDCLTLNVTVPTDTTRSDQPLPVMFWIHGGGHQYGSGGGIYESPSLANQGVILVSINYRLGLYGFLAHPELANEDPNGSTGNYGTLDQIAALQWVRDNIERFGGDPDNVTIFGESAGGHSVGQLMASPLTRGLFHRAIAQSGSGFQQFQTTDQSLETISGFQAGRRLAEMMGVSGEQEILALRQLDTDALRPAAVSPELNATFHPQVDGYV
ncbi:MAG: carboxylesterase family protein, partial [Pseudomonadales bacterium]|nr:carboxylesterase family protein [Pseudomonadales bacterium]